VNLPEDEIHIWQVALSDVDPAALTHRALAWLQAKDVVRYERLVQQRHRLEFLLGKWLTRICLSEYSDLAMGDWQFIDNAYGKPQPGEGLGVQAPFFNLSHSNGRAVLAVSRTPELGVDIEFTGRKRRVAKIAHRYFADEEIQTLLALPDSAQQSRFYELWSLKEAYIKARGLGLAIPLRSFAYTFSPNRVGLNEMTRSSSAQWRWQIWQLHTGLPYALALAVQLQAGDSSRSLRAFSFRNMTRHSEEAVAVLRASA
tara:strand:+ start:583 stop:1353 length:771 start_codon:yes stop_codon:yes gene_type:complete